MNFRFAPMQFFCLPVFQPSNASRRTHGWAGLVLVVLLGVFGLCASGPASAQVTPASVTTQLASGGFYVPLGIALDKANNVYVADWSAAHVIKEYLATNGVVTPGQNYVGLGGYLDLYNLTIDGNGNIFTTTYGDCNVQEILAVNGSVPLTNPTVRTLYNDSVTYSGYCSTDGIALDAAGDVYFTDINAGTVTELVAVNGVVPSNPIVIALGGSGWSQPRDVKVDAQNNVWVADYAAKKITKMPAGCAAKSCVTTAYTVPGTSGPFNLFFDASGDLFFSDYNSYNIWEITAVGGVIPANPTATLVTATGLLAAEIAVDAKGNVYYAADGSNSGAFEFGPGPSSIAFGSVNLGSSSSQTVTLTVAAGQKIGTISFLTKGAPNLDFTSGGGTCTAQTYTVTTNCTLTVKFTPTAAGQRMGAVRIVDGASPTPHVLLTEYVSGTGVGPVATFPGVISTYVGGPQGLPITACTGQTNSYGDGCQATKAFLNTPHLLSTDGVGNLYIGDYQNHAIRKVDVATGVITSIAGANGSGYSGDGGLATQAQLSYPWGQAVDGAGNVYIADFGNNIIRRVDAVTGIITTVAGTPGQRGVNIGNGGLATNAQLSLPTSVAIDGAGNLYIVDSFNTIRMVNAATGIISIVAGSGSANAPAACTSPTATCGDGGLATSALLNNPVAIALDGAGNLYITDAGDARVRMVTASTGIITTIAGNGTRNAVDNVQATSSGFYNLYGIVVDPSGNVIVGDSQNMKVRKINMSTGIITTIAGTGAQSYSGDGGPATSATFYLPSGLALDSVGNLYISDVLNFVIRKINTSASPSYTFNTANIGSTSTDSPYTFTLSNAGNAPLVFTTPSSGTNPLFGGSVPASYSLSNSGTCPQVVSSSSTQSLAVGQSCTYQVSFTPTATSNAAKLTITDNSLPSTQLITLGGTGLVTTVAPSVATVSAVSTPYGSTAGIVVTATESGTNGSASGDVVTFSVASPATGSFSPTTCNIGSAGTCTVTYTPTGTLSAGTYTNKVSASLAAGANYLAASATSTLTVTQLTPTVSIGTIGTVPYLATTAVVTGSITGTGPTVPGAAGGTTVKCNFYAYPGSTLLASSTGTVTAGTTSSTYSCSVPSAVTATGGQYTVNVSFNGDTNYAATTAVTQQFAVQATTGVLLTSSVNPILLQNSTTLTATVSSSAGTPTGTVTFLDGTTSLGAANLVGGTAILPVSFTSTGTHSLTASYAATTNYASASSTALNEVVQDFSLNISVAGGSVTSVTVAPGGTALYTLVISPVNGATFPANVSLSASGLPAGATATFSPASISAGSGATTVTMSISVPSSHFARLEPGLDNRKLPPVAFALLLIPFVGRLRRKARSLGRAITLALVVMAGIVAGAGLTGCATNVGFFSQAPATYNITVTGTAGSLSHSTNVTLTVE